MKREMIRRRAFVVAAGTTAIATPCAARPDRRSALRLGFSLYGMKELRTEEAIRKVREIGYDSVELCLLPGFDAEPIPLAADRRRGLRDLLRSSGLVLGALMEQLNLGGDEAKQEEATDRLKRAAELGHELSPDAPPVVETTMGEGKWEDVRETFRDRLRRWAEAAKQSSSVLAVKPRRFGAVNRPEQAVWLVDQVKSRWLRLAYEYSHFAHRDMPLAKTVSEMIPHTSFIHVKDEISPLPDAGGRERSVDGRPRQPLWRPRPPLRNTGHVTVSRCATRTRVLSPPRCRSPRAARARMCPARTWWWFIRPS